MRNELAALLCGAAALGVAAPAASQDLTPVSVGQVTTMSLSLAPLVAGQELGFFEEEGLDVEILEFQGTGVLIPQMVSKRVLIGYPNPDALIVSREPGKDWLPLKFFYNNTRISGWEFVVLKDSEIQSIADLKGKRLGVGALTWGNIPITTALLEENDITVGEDIQLVPVGVGGPAFLALQNRNVDALNLFDSQHATLEAQGVDIRRLDMGEKYTSLFSNGFIAHEDTIEEQPEVLAGFGRAFAKATIVCDENPEYCVEAFWERYPNQRPSEGTEEEQLAAGVTIMTARTKKFLTFNEGEEPQLGRFPAEGWENFVDVLHAGGQLSTTDIDVSTLYTNQFVDEFNSFDEEAIRAMARDL